MGEDILTQTYYGNTVAEWATSLGIIVAALVVGKALYWIFSKTMRALTSKTKTMLDDIIIDMIEEPIVFAICVWGIWYGISRLHLPETAQEWFASAVQALIILSVTWLIARLLNALFTHYLAPLAEKSENTLDDQLLPIVRKGVNLSIWAIGIIVALNNAGYDVGAVIAGLGIGGLALAMAARDTVANIFGGFTIFTDRPFTIQDRVKVDSYDGVVDEIGIRSTRLRTLAGTLVTIPNSTFSDSPVENVSAEPSRKITLTLGLTYDTTAEGMEKGLEILRRIVAENDHLEEKVLAGFTGFGDFSMNITFIYYIKKGADIMDSQTEVNMEILKRFAAAGLDFAFPTQTLYTIPQNGAPVPAGNA